MRVAVLAAIVAAEPHSGHNCDEHWEQVRWEMSQIFTPDLDITRVMACLSTPECKDTSAILLVDALTCSSEVLPTVTSSVPCTLGMLHYMLVCALQMWLQGHFRQSALYYDHALGFLALTKGSLDGSKWPLWTGQVLQNWQNFLNVAFPASAIIAEERGTGNGTYLSVGLPVQQNSSWWTTGPRRSSYCPPQGDQFEGLKELSMKEEGTPSVLCAVPLVWPGEEAAAQAIAETYGAECDRLVFFLASPDAETAEAARQVLMGYLPGAEVVDLAKHWPEMLRDRPSALAAHGRKGISGANQKDLLLFAYLAASNLTDWVCRVETDSYFIPANFRRFVRGRRLEAKESFYLGSLAYWHLHFEPRMLFNEQVQCLSKAAVERLGTAVSNAPWASEASYARDIMLGLCLAEVGIGPYPDVADAWGREYFLNYRMEDMAMHAPYRAYGDMMPDPRHIESNAAIHWRGKAHIFMPCLETNQFWASPYPISFHDYKDVGQMRQVHEIFLGNAKCEGCPAGYLPLIAERWKMDECSIRCFVCTCVTNSERESGR
eukprot:symbB.v1.2.021981.t1/scaffold1899.1/size238565/17